MLFRGCSIANALKFGNVEVKIHNCAPLQDFHALFVTLHTCSYIINPYYNIKYYYNIKPWYYFSNIF